MVSSRWRKSDESDDFFCCPNHASKNIFYARIFTVHQRYDYSDTNNWINNLKKPPASSSQAELGYKSQAIQKFANEAARLFKASSSKNFVLVPIPSSSIKGHPDYDDRIDRVAVEIVKQCSNVTYLPILIGIKNRDPSHKSIEARSVEKMFESMGVDSTQEPNFDPETLVVILDDVATSGSSIEAARLHLEKILPVEKIVAVVWAKAKNLSDENPF